MYFSKHRYNSACIVLWSTLVDLSNVTCVPLFVVLLLQTDKIT